MRIICVFFCPRKIRNSARYRQGRPSTRPKKSVRASILSSDMGDIELIMADQMLQEFLLETSIFEVFWLVLSDTTEKPILTKNPKNFFTKNRFFDADFCTGIKVMLFTRFPHIHSRLNRFFNKKNLLFRKLQILDFFKKTSLALTEFAFSGALHTAK